MRVLLDECLPHRLKRSMTGHYVTTVADEGWSGECNGKLLSLAAEKFDVFITVDKNIPSQQNLQRLAIGIVVLQSTSNRFQDLEPLIPTLLQSLKTIRPGDLMRLATF